MQKFLKTQSNQWKDKIAYRVQFCKRMVERDSEDEFLSQLKKNKKEWSGVDEAEK